MDEIGASIRSFRKTAGLTQPQLAKKIGVEMPITEQLYNVLFCGGDVRKSLGILMSRPKKHEIESLFNPNV